MGFCFRLRRRIVRMLLVMCILGDPGAVSRAGRKGATKVFKCGRKNTWVPTLTGPFPNGQVNAGYWLGTKKMLCIIVPNRRTVSPEFFSWVRTRRLLLLLSRQSNAVRSPSFPNQTKELLMIESKNVSDAISRSNSICTEKILFVTDHNVS